MEYYAGLINFALTTIIYSTFISPSLQKLNSLRGDVSNIDFFVPDGENDAESIIKQKGRELNSKIVQYEAVYREIKTFLKYFYCILAIIISAQILQMIISKSLNVQSIVAVGLSFIVIVLLSLAIRSSMIKPYKIRSLSWLASAGNVTPGYYRPLFAPKLWINNRTLNELSEPSDVNIQIAAEIKFRGFSFIMTIESPAGDRLYFVSAGTFKDKVSGRTVIYPDGRIEHPISICRMKLKPNSYVARLLIFEAPYGGKHHPVETILSFIVQKDSIPAKTKQIDLTEKSRNYSYITKRGGVIKDISFVEGFSNDAAIINLLSVDKFRKRFIKSRVPFTMQSKDGMLTQAEINKNLSVRRRTVVFLKRTGQALIKKRSTYIVYSKKNTQ